MLFAALPLGGMLGKHGPFRNLGFRFGNSDECPSACRACLGMAAGIGSDGSAEWELHPPGGNKRA